MNERESTGEPREPLTPEADAAARADFDRAAAEREAGDTDAARESFLRAVASGHPDIGPMALANLAVLEAAAGRAAQARAAFERAIATAHPEHAPKSLFNYALFHERDGDLTHAREFYQRAIDTGHPEHARKALLNLANLAARQGRLGEATALFLRAMEPPFLGDTAVRAHRRLVEVDPSRLADAREVYLRAIRGEDEDTAAQARDLLYDLDPGHSVPPPTISLRGRRFALTDIESAEWATGRRPAYSSGHLDIYTHDGELHTLYIDLRDPYDRRAYDWLRQHLGDDTL
ncbi:tetratricopeptide repeat protein [Streptomyces sp. NPDC059070]|uniref:tetratricopeptide repeat protein n=1 Tax=unclassified Streptomyces TaxID=2593676 RepID=UPI0034E1C481